MSKDAINPDHYKAGGIECIDYLKAKLTPEQFVGYLRGQVLKYQSRLGRKDKPSQDAEKAHWYGERLVRELKEQEAAAEQIKSVSLCEEAHRRAKDSVLDSLIAKQHAELGDVLHQLKISEVTKRLVERDLLMCGSAFLAPLAVPRPDGSEWRRVPPSYVRLDTACGPDQTVSRFFDTRTGSEVIGMVMLTRDYRPMSGPFSGASYHDISDGVKDLLHAVRTGEWPKR